MAFSTIQPAHVSVLELSPAYLHNNLPTIQYVDANAEIKHLWIATRMYNISINKVAFANAYQYIAAKALKWIQLHATVDVSWRFAVLAIGIIINVAVCDLYKSLILNYIFIWN